MQRTSDAAIMLPMFEMAGNRFKFINEILLIHNCANILNDHKEDPKLQSEIDGFIRKQKPL